MIPFKLSKAPQNLWPLSYKLNPNISQPKVIQDYEAVSPVPTHYLCLSVKGHFFLFLSSFWLSKDTWDRFHLSMGFPVGSLARRLVKLWCARQSSGILLIRSSFTKSIADEKAKQWFVCLTPPSVSSGTTNSGRDWIFYLAGIYWMGRVMGLWGNNSEHEVCLLT